MECYHCIRMFTMGLKISSYNNMYIKLTAGYMIIQCENDWLGVHLCEDL